MYAGGALLIGIQLDRGRALERSPDGDTVSFSIRGAFLRLPRRGLCLVHHGNSAGEGIGSEVTD
jgi:hypothetical protein